MVMETQLGIPLDFEELHPFEPGVSWVLFKSHLSVTNLQTMYHNYV